MGPMIMLMMIMGISLLAAICIGLVILINRPNHARQQRYYRPIPKLVDKDTLEILDKLNSGQMTLDQAAKVMHQRLRDVSGIENVLKMVDEKKILPEEGLKLINALCVGKREELALQGKIKKRSKGVLTFGILIILFNICAVLINFRSRGLLPMPFIFQLTLFLFTAIVNILSLFCGIFILRLREWARQVVLGLCIFQLFIFVPASSFMNAYIFGIKGFVLGFAPALIFSIGWPILVLIFFTRPNVKEQFGVLPTKGTLPSSEVTVKRLYRSKKSKLIAGICGGFGEYFDKDPVFMKIIFVALVFITGLIPGILFYLIGWIVIPLKESN